MKITEILEQLPIGEVVPKKVLAVLKRVGLIYDYSWYGYLESAKLVYSYEDGERGSNYQELFPLKNAPKDGFVGNLSYDDYMNKYPGGRIKYKEWEFDTKYLSGCFKPYLVKASGPTKDNKTVNRSMSLWGAIG